MTVAINGEPRRIAERTTVGDLLRELGLTNGGIAVAVNERVVSRSALEGRSLTDGDAVEIIRAVSGG